MQLVHWVKRLEPFAVLPIYPKALAYRAGITKNQVQLIESGRGSARESGPISNPRMKTPLWFS